LLRAAEDDADAAAARYRALRVAASESIACIEGSAPRRPLSTWQQLLLLVLGGGLLTGFAIIWLLATAFVGPAALLFLPATAGLVAAYIVFRRRQAPRIRRRPVVADLVHAAQEVKDALVALELARDRSAAASDRRVPGPPSSVAPAPARDRVPWPCRAQREAQRA
jgi:hypothetical protein